MDRLMQAPLGLAAGEVEALLTLPLGRLTAEGERELRDQLRQAQAAHLADHEG